EVSLIEALEKKMSEILNIETLHDNSCDYMWFAENLTKKQEKDRTALKMDMERIINEDKINYGSIIEFDIKHLKIPTKEQRQDKIQYGIKGELNESQLALVSLYSTDMSFNASQMYDLDTYLSQLLLRAHMLNTPFQQTVLSLFSGSSLSNGKNLWIDFGPVKKVKRCREKTELECY
ncbi:hypothetical protein RFI_05469, partial [Reticulomyxa filosa]